MPAQADETTLLTVFADVHYFFSPQTYKPLHHRFEKASYVYVHRNASTGRGRVEIANNAGTPDQDAFAGALENAHVTYTYTKPTFLSIDLPNVPDAQLKPWQIAGFDQRNEKRYKYTIASIDLYIWTPEDALDLVESLSTVDSIGALDVEISPDDQQDAQRQQQQQQDTVSPVVQQLEQAAIGPEYKRESTSTTQSIPGPPSAAPPTQSNAGGVTQASADAAAAFAAPAPLAYNPAAPVAPEARVHREKTPPPPDGDVPIAGTLAGTQQQPYSTFPGQYQPQGASQPYQPQAQAQAPYQPGRTYSYGSAPPAQQQQPQAYVPGQSSPSQTGQSPPPVGIQQQSSLPPPPPPTQGPVPSHSPPAQGQHPYAQQFPAPPAAGPPGTMPSPPQQQHQQGYSPQQQQTYSPQQQQQYSPQQQQQQQQHNTPPIPFGSKPPQSPGFPPGPMPGQYQSPLSSPGLPPGHAQPQGQYHTPLASPGLPPQPQQQPQSQFGYPQQQPQQQPQGGYSQYSYATNQQPTQPAHNIHQQFYRPTAAEMGGKPPPPAPGQPSQQPALSGKGNRVEKGMNRFLQKLDKKF